MAVYKEARLRSVCRFELEEPGCSGPVLATEVQGPKHGLLSKLVCYSLKMEAAGSSEMLVSSEQDGVPSWWTFI